MKKILSLVFIFVFLFTNIVEVWAMQDNSNIEKKNLFCGVVKSAYIPSVNATGENLKNDVQVGSLYQIEDSSTVITSAIYENEMIDISGSIDEVLFHVTGTFCSISENENVLVFASEDKLDNFHVVYCATEKNIVNSSLYFKDFATENPIYNVVTKLYLKSKIGNNYIMIELFGNEFPVIEEESIAGLPENHQLNMCWYAKEFKPVNSSMAKEEILTRADSRTFLLLGYYEYSLYGMIIRHYMNYKETCDIRDVVRNSTSTASATLEITGQRIEAPLPNDCSSDSSALSLREVSIVYLTRPYTAAQSLCSTGVVTESASIITNFSFDLGVGLKSLTATPSISFTWQPYNNNKTAGVVYAAHTNAPGSYWREAEAKLKKSYRLSSVGNNFCVNWTYGAYETTNVSSHTAKIVFKYMIHNALDYTQTRSVIDEKAITVNVL